MEQELIPKAKNFQARKTTVGKSKQHKGDVICSSQEQTHAPVLCIVCDNAGNQSTASE